MNPLINSIVGIVFDNLATLGIEQIKQSLEKIHRKQILQTVCEKFYDMPYRVAEYPSLVYSHKLIGADDLTEDCINPALPVEKIAEIILPVIRNSFISDTETDYLDIAHIISEYYKQCAIITIRLSDLSKQLEQASNQTLDELKSIQEIQTKNQQLKDRNDLKKSFIYKEYVQFRINDLVSCAVQNFYHLIFKNPITTYGNEDFVTAGFASIREKISTDDEKLWDTEYWRNPVDVIIPLSNPPQLKPQQLNPKDYIESFLPVLYTKIDEVLRYKEVLPDSVYYQILKFDSYLRQDLSFKYSSSLGVFLSTAKYKKEDIHRTLITWCNYVLELADLYREPVRS